MTRFVFTSMVALMAALSAGCGASSDRGSDGNPSSGAGSTGQGGGLSAGGSSGTNAQGGGGGSTGVGGTDTGASGGSSGSASTGGASTGGASTSGGTGNGGSGGQPNPVNNPSACDALPAPGTWEQIWPESDGQGDFGSGYSEAIAVDPFDSAILWFQVGYQGLYKSTDCGATFTHVSTGTLASTFNSGNHVGIAVDRVDQGTLYSCSIHAATGMFKSTNGGVDWVSLVQPGSEMYEVTGGNIDAMSVDPNDHEHIVVGMHANCSEPYGPACVAETTDGGVTWDISKIPASSWEEGAGPWVINTNTWLYGGNELYVTTNGGDSFAQVTPSGTWGFYGGEVQVHPIITAGDGTFLLTSSQGIAKSSDGVSWSLIPNSGGRKVGMTRGNGKIFTSDQWSATYHVADENDPTSWSTVPGPPPPGDHGSPYIEYDEAHHILYSSTFGKGLWRLVTE